MQTIILSILSYAILKKNDNVILATTAVMKAKLVGNNLTNQENIFLALAFSRTRLYFGSRLQFENDDFIYVAVDRTRNWLGRIFKLIPIEN